jgi:hypothetical protein
MVFLYQKQHDCHLLFPRLKIKLKGRPFDTTEVIEAESQAFAENLTENYFEDASKNTYVQKETTSRVMVASMPKVSV